MEKIEIIVGGSMVLPKPDLRVSDRLLHEFEFPNPKYRATFITKQSREDIPEYLSAITEHPDGSIEVPRSAVNLVKKVLIRCELEAKWTDQRSPGSPIDAVEVPLRGYQEEAFRAIRDKQHGVVMMPCGGGKTRAGVATIGRLARSAIVLVHTEDLLDQWVSTIKELLGVEAGVVADGKADWKPITVCMNRTLLNMMRTAVNCFGKPVPGPWDNYGVCIVDECHRCPSSTYREIISRIPSKWRLGLTATERDDSMNRVMYWTMGEKIFEVQSDFLMRSGYLIPAEIEEVSTDFEFEFSGRENMRMVALTRAIVSSASRNEQIAKRAAEEAARGESVLVLSNHKAHCARIGKLIEKHGGKPLVLVGSLRKEDIEDGIERELIVHKKKDRKKVIADMRSGERRILVATSLADEGIDLPILSRVILALPGASHRAVQQQVGRAMRPFKGKFPRLIDFVDRKVETLVNRYRERRAVYRKLGLI